MLRDAFYIARMDARYLLSRRETILWTFVMPMIFFYFIGAIMENGRDSRNRDPISVSVPADAGFLADQLITRLEQRGYLVVRPKTEQQFRAATRRLEIPARFTASVLAGAPQDVSFARNGQDTDAEYDRIRVNRAVYTVLADLTAIRKSGAEPSPERFAEIAAAPHALTLEAKPAGQRVEPPFGFEQSVPGTMVMFTLLVLFTAGAVFLTIERRHGILRRLASSPMSRGAVVLGKYGARMIVGSIQIGFAMLAGSLLFHVSWGPHLPVVLVVMFAYGSLAAALALLLGNAGRTESQVIGMGVIASNLMSGLGGCWWPIEITPEWAQKASLFLPTGLTMNAIHKLVNFGAPPSSVIPHIAALTIAAAVALYVLSKTFRFQ